MPKDNAPTFKIEGAKLIYRNFTGVQSAFNAKGDRNFCVVLDPEDAEKMLHDGWNVKFRDARDDGDAPLAFVQVRVNYSNYPPRIVTLSPDMKRRLSITEDMVETLDWADILNADLICRGHEWDIQGKTGIKAYCKSLFLVVDEDELERKYANIGTGDG